MTDLERLQLECESYRTTLVQIRELAINPNNSPPDPDELLRDLNKCTALADAALKAFIPIPTEQPEHSCAQYIHNARCSPEFIIISQFEQLAKDGQFLDGPFIETFGDGYGEPYNPNRQVFGTLRDGRVVFSRKVAK